MSRNIPFTKSLQLDVFHPEASSELRPVIVLIHGGAWQSGSKELSHFSDQLEVCGVGTTLEGAGYVCVIPDYSSSDPDAICEDSLDDIAAALNWTEENIGAYFGDPTRINLMGFCAGAHLCATTVLHNLLPSKLHHPLPHSLPKIHSMILLAGCYNLDKQLHHEANRPPNDLDLRLVMERNLSNVMRAGTFTDRSPLFMLNELGLPDHAHLPQRWLLIHAENDQVINKQQSVEMSELLMERGGGLEKVRLMIIPPDLTSKRLPTRESKGWMEFELDYEHMRLVHQLKPPAQSAFAKEALEAIAEITRF
ncbi:hypothetical protein HDU98_002461 [Podochytrium sp. JEL0797]|nr:hypothetical protein HDU98_002461 [Podochytrium sp. JEL0797]